MKQWMLSAFLIGCLAFPCQADVIYFTDGKTLSVENSWTQGDELKCEFYGLVVGFPLAGIDRIEEGEMAFPDEADESVSAPDEEEALTEPEILPEKKKPLSEIHLKTRSLYLELLEFRKDPAFHQYGFAPGTRYQAWKNRLDRLRAHPDVSLLYTDEIAAGDLLMLANIYRKSTGEETSLSEGLNQALQNILLP